MSMPPAGSPSYYLIHVPPPWPASFIWRHSPSNKTADLLRPARQRAKSRTGNPWGMAKNTTQVQKQQFSWIHAATASRLLLTARRMERSRFSASYAGSRSELQPPHTFQDVAWISALRSALFHCFSVDVCSLWGRLQLTGWLETPRWV